jgi:uncharacterized membrane protein
MSKKHRSRLPNSTATQLPRTSEEAPAADVLMYEEVGVSYQGPLPPPEMLVQYNQAYPGCAQDIVKMAVSQSEHRQHLEKRVVDAQILGERIGQFSSLLGPPDRARRGGWET